MLAPSLLGQSLTFAGTLFFFLIGRGQIYDFVTQRLSAPDRRAVTSNRLRDAEAQVSRYFLTITATNAGLGLATAAALIAIGLPDAALWGALAFALNFIVYLGPAILAIGLVVAGIAVFDGPMVMLPAAAFLALNLIEGQFVTPAIVGNRLAVNPLVVFLSIIFGIWLWGPIGGIVAIPVLLWLRVLSSGVAPPPSAVPVETT
jgi:predicted PurR-regulated permease PerM